MCCVVWSSAMVMIWVNKAILEGFDVCDVGVYGRGGERAKERYLMRWMMSVLYVCWSLVDVCCYVCL